MSRSVVSLLIRYHVEQGRGRALSGSGRPLARTSAGLARGSDSTGRVSPFVKPDTLSTAQAMPDTPTKALEYSEIRDLLHGAKQEADAMVTECSFDRAAALDGLAANLATLLEWSRLHHSDGIVFFLTTNCAVYIDNIAPTVCCTQHDAVRCARYELKLHKTRDFANLLEFVADDSQSPTADDFAQVGTVHKTVSERQAAVVAEIVVSQRVIERVDTPCRRGAFQVLLFRRRAAGHVSRKGRQDQWRWWHFHCPFGRHPLHHCWSPAEASEALSRGGLPDGWH